jgi:myosin heavy subunit
LAEPNVLQNLKERYAKKEIYTSTTAKVLAFALLSLTQADSHRHTITIPITTIVIITITPQVLIAVNPYTAVKGLDTEDMMRQYQQAPINLEGSFHLLLSSHIAAHALR